MAGLHVKVVCQWRNPTMHERLQQVKALRAEWRGRLEQRPSFQFRESFSFPSLSIIWIFILTVKNTKATQTKTC